MKTVIVNINLLVLRYVVYDQDNQLHELLCLQWPWTSLNKLIGEHTTA